MWLNKAANINTTIIVFVFQLWYFFYFINVSHETFTLPYIVLLTLTTGYY